MKKIFLSILVLLVLTSSYSYAQEPGLIPDIFGKTYSDNAYIRFGDNQDAICGYNTAQTADAFICGLSTDSETFILMQKGDIGTNVGIADAGTPTLVILNSDPTKYAKFYHDGTNTVISSSTGVVSFPSGISGALSASGLTSYSDGVAVTAASYQVGRDADGTNQLHLNVPTSATIEMSVNDTAEFVLSATSANFQNNTITTSGNITSSGTSDLGWSVVAGANTACNTTCTNACVFGQNTADMSIVDCATATADVCVCAGSN